MAVDTKKRYNLTHLRLAFCGSAALNEDTAKMFYEKFSIHIKQGYGLAEICVITLNLTSTLKYKSIGKPIKAIEYKIADDKELLVKSNALYSGYINQASLSAEYLATGDLVELDEEDNMYLLGRKTSFININGLKVYPAEIEQIIYSSKLIESCCVKASSDHINGEAIEAHLSLKSSEDYSEITNKISLYLSDHLEKIKHPKDIYIHLSLPKSPLGKILTSKVEKQNAIYHRNFS